jgi:inner membrane protein
MNNNPQPLDRFQKWMAESIGLKVFVITILILLLMIPNSHVKDIISERQGRLHEAVREVSSKWAHPQRLSGPVLIVPYFQVKSVKRDGETRLEKSRHKAYLFPEELNVDSDVQVQSLRRGIFDIIVYTGDITFNGHFSQLPFEKMNIPESQIDWGNARMHIGITDNRGIVEIPEILINNQKVNSEPFADVPEHLSTGMATLPMRLDTNFSFSVNMKLRGSSSLKFIPIGKQTSVKIAGDWADPKFDGNHLPVTREVADSGFHAEWKVLDFNRDFGQEFKDQIPNISRSAFGVELIMPVGQYQQSMRTAKYALLIIVLTFVSLFLLENFSQVRINSLQYVLIGLALILYYSLLLGISEHFGFNTAYLSSSIATTALIAVYSGRIFRSFEKGLVIGALLSVFYVFIFVITKAQDYALLIGNIGLFIALAVVMYSTTKFKKAKE